MPYTVWRAGKNSHFHSTAVKNLASRFSPGLCCCLTILAGCALIPYAGIQMDEALFAGPYYQPVQREFRIRLFHHDIPLMVMTYIGTLKTLLYWPLLAIFRSGFEAHPQRAAEYQARAASALRRIAASMGEDEPLRRSLEGAPETRALFGPAARGAYPGRE